jgi:exo-beta-1,3-glucanase (GH17 family)
MPSNMMRTGLVALGALSLMNFAAAKPSGHHRKFGPSTPSQCHFSNNIQGRHQELHEKRQDVVYETDYTYDTVDLPDVVVYVNQDGVPYSTNTDGQPAATPAAPAVAPAVNLDVNVNVGPASTSATSTSIYATPTTLSPVYNKVAAVSASVALGLGSKSLDTSKGPSGYGLAYSPYTDSGECKSQDQVTSDFATINAFAQSNGDSWAFVRIYGTDCNQVSTVLKAGADYNLKIFAGIYNIWDDAAFATELKTMISAANGDWSRFNTIAIGNEVVNGGKLAASAVAGKVATAKSTLQAAGYSGPIVAVDTLVAVIANPVLCDSSDYVAVNAHAFFDANVVASNAGTWLLEQMQRVSSVCGGKEVVISETGWPTQGSTNGAAVPSIENQKSAIGSIKQTVTSKVVYLSAFNDMWKTNSADTFNAEQFWGICN